MDKEALIHNIIEMESILDDIIIEKNLYKKLKNTCKQLIDMLEDGRIVKTKGKGGREE